MFLLLILPILVSGYSAFITNPYHYYRLHRYEGQLLYLESARIGFMCTLASFLSIISLNAFVPPYIQLYNYQININLFEFVKSLLNSLTVDSEQLTWVILTTLGSLLVSKIYVSFVKFILSLRAFDILDAFSIRRIKISLKRKKWFSREDESGLTYKERTKIILMASVLKDSPLDHLFLKSYVIDGFYLMLTMEDRKVYIGRVISLGEPNESSGMDQEITITPYISGFRNEDNLSLKLTTKYTDVSDDVSLVLRQDKIISATYFSESIYEEFLLNQRKNLIVSP